MEELGRKGKKTENGERGTNVASEVHCEQIREGSTGAMSASER